jgi:hypothetical protein
MVIRDPGHEKQMLLYIVVFIAILIMGGMYAYMGSI